MAQQIVVDFTVKTGAATREVDDLKKKSKALIRKYKTLMNRQKKV